MLVEYLNHKNDYNETSNFKHLIPLLFDRGNPEHGVQTQSIQRFHIHRYQTLSMYSTRNINSKIQEFGAEILHTLRLSEQTDMINEYILNRTLENFSELIGFCHRFVEFKNIPKDWSGLIKFFTIFSKYL
ncbi:MAG: hypothetical protein NZO16_04795 [Deltaproteobacteria bacterium]|nr:hypothetical protein [Deltaproteobacteria bacterium]